MIINEAEKTAAGTIKICIHRLVDQSSVWTASKVAADLSSLIGHTNSRMVVGTCIAEGGRDANSAVDCC